MIVKIFLTIAGAYFIYYLFLIVKDLLFTPPAFYDDQAEEISFESISENLENVNISDVESMKMPDQFSLVNEINQETSSEDFDIDKIKESFQIEEEIDEFEGESGQR